MSKRVDRDLTSMRIHNSTKKRLIQLAGRLQVESGENMTLEDAITYALTFLEKHESGKKSEG